MNVNTQNAMEEIRDNRYDSTQFAVPRAQMQ